MPTTARSTPNIALIKYWGNRDEDLRLCTAERDERPRIVRGGRALRFEATRPPALRPREMRLTRRIQNRELFSNPKQGTPLHGVPQIAPRGLLWLTAAAVYLQILLGATVRHTGAGLVCVDLPFCRGALWPAGVHPMVHLHMAHRAFAFVVLGLVCWSSLRVARCSRGLVRALAWSAPALVVIQIALGILTIVTFKDLVPVTAHLLVAALLLADHAALLAMTREPDSVPLALGVAA